jgi:hypothetical protein
LDRGLRDQLDRQCGCALCVGRRIFEPAHRLEQFTAQCVGVTQPALGVVSVVDCGHLFENDDGFAVILVLPQVWCTLDGIVRLKLP